MRQGETSGGGSSEDRRRQTITIVTKVGRGWWLQRAKLATSFLFCFERQLQGTRRGGKCLFLLEHYGCTINQLFWRRLCTEIIIDNAYTLFAIGPLAQGIALAPRRGMTGSWGKKNEGEKYNSTCARCKTFILQVGKEDCLRWFCPLSSRTMFADDSDTVRWTFPPYPDFWIFRKSN